MPDYQPIDYRLRCHTKRTDLPADVVRDIGEAYAEIERLRNERDEARRTVCEMSIRLGGVYRRIGGKIVEVTTPEGCAEIMRWDCFKENTDD